MISLANETVQNHIDAQDVDDVTLAERTPVPSPTSDWKKMCKMSKLRPLKTEDFLNVIDEAMFEKAQELVF